DRIRVFGRIDTQTTPTTALARTSGLRRIVRAFIFSLHGVRTAFKSEAAFRQECAFAIVLVPVAVWLGRTGVERAILAGTCLIVLIVELLNTAVEYVVDRIGAEHH